MEEIDWLNLPYNHSGSWEKNMDSIMSPGTKVTWPQLIAEFVIYWRTKYIDSYKGIKQGEGWYRSIAAQVRKLNQQASVICNYFPHPNDEPMVIVAFRNWFRNNRTMKIGQFRKVRSTTKNGKTVVNITQDEKDTVYGLKTEFDKIIKQRKAFLDAVPDDIVLKPTFKTNTEQTKKNLRSLGL